MREQWEKRVYRRVFLYLALFFLCVKKKKNARSDPFDRDRYVPTVVGDRHWFPSLATSHRSMSRLRSSRHGGDGLRIHQWWGMGTRLLSCGWSIVPRAAVCAD